VHTYLTSEVVELLLGDAAGEEQRQHGLYVAEYDIDAGLKCVQLSLLVRFATQFLC
jgi:hypothetical protein